MQGPKRHFIVPDIQAKPGVPLDHCDWIGRAAVEYKPDVIVALGDVWDFSSLSSYEQPGSLKTEGQRYLADLEAGDEAFRRISEPIEKASKRGDWRPRKIFLVGNHEDRADRAAIAQPKFFGHIGSEQCDTRGWERHEFLETVFVDGICYSHYFANSHSGRPIGGEVSNRLNKIGCSFVQGHEQGFRDGNKIMACGRTYRGVVAGSCYLHQEEYRGRQGQRHWQGVVVLNEVENGEFCMMELTLQYLCRKYEHKRLSDYMASKYPWGDWRHLSSEGLNETGISSNAVQPPSGRAGLRPPASVPGRSKPAKAGHTRLQSNRAHASGGRARRA